MSMKCYLPATHQTRAWHSIRLSDLSWYFEGIFASSQPSVKGRDKPYHLAPSISPIRRHQRMGHHGCPGWETDRWGTRREERKCSLLEPYFVSDFFSWGIKLVKTHTSFKLSKIIIRVYIRKHMRTYRKTSFRVVTFPKMWLGTEKE